jgi:hypothetical protein|tara:strand:+ start:83 stop:1378 length:1296 start_codon:yes stop_codon:yes gene_type:complete
MEKFKIYIHHYYTYELFWYFCHGLEIEPIDVPTWFDKNKHNKFIKIEDAITLRGIYKGNDIEIIFCNHTLWDSSDGFHLFDYSVDLSERGLTSDRGFNSNIMYENDEKNRKLLNHNAKFQNVAYMYIDWEGHDSYVAHNWIKTLNPRVQVFVDEKQTPKRGVMNHHYAFTNTVWSFLSPNTLGIRDYYFFHDYLKYKNDYKYKINVPIRRLYGDKAEIAEKVLSLNNPNITVTHSSFGNTAQYAEDISGFRKEIISKIPSENFIDKRGYGIHDWGGEWNDNNMNENMWKMFGISEVTILFEHSPLKDFKTNEFSYLVGQSYMTEKTISHIMVGKPFIPFHIETVNFYNNVLKKYNKPTVDFPMQYSYILEKLEWLGELTQDEERWNEFLELITKWTLNLRTGLVEIIHENNCYLDYVVNSKITKLKKPTFI